MHETRSGTADDVDLLRQSALGDTTAFDVLVASHQSAVSRFLTSLGVDDVDDVLQDTFIAAWQSAGSFQGTGSVRSWLLSIARNVYRHSKRRRVNEPAAFVPLDILAQRAGWGCDPSEARRVDIALARDVIEHALAILPDEDREILVLRELEELSGDETAQLLQLTVPAMKSRLHRARLHLAAVLRRLDQPHSSTGGAHVSH